MSPISRITMIKMKEQNVEIALKEFEVFTKTQNKDGSPYILSMEAGPAYGPAREEGYTLVVRNVFKDEKDMQFYERECPAHERYRVFLSENAPVQELKTVCFRAEISFAM